MDTVHFESFSAKAEPGSGGYELIKVKEENATKESCASTYLDEPGISTVKYEPAWGAEGDELCTDVHTSCPYVEEECAKISRVKPEPGASAMKSVPRSGSHELNKVKEENHKPDTSSSLDEPEISAVKSESAWGGDEFYDDVDIIYTDVKEECAAIFSDSQVSVPRIPVCPESDDLTCLPQMMPNHARGRSSKRSMSSPERSYASNLKSSKRYVLTHSEEKRISCTLCDYKCRLKSKLSKHMYTHTREKPLSCTMCDYRCVWKSDLNRHMFTHSGEKPISCTMCDYKCTLKSVLNKHMFNHTEEKPISCTLCDYRCRIKSKLNQHMYTHTKEKPISCAMCDYKCVWKSDLNKHMPIHTGEKPISCTMCDYKCTVKSVLKKHMLYHTEDKLISCTRCDYKCCSNSKLIQHMFTHII